jgi:hypothetical protein
MTHYDYDARMKRAADIFEPLIRRSWKELVVLENEGVAPPSRTEKVHARCLSAQISVFQDLWTRMRCYGIPLVAAIALLSLPAAGCLPSTDCDIAGMRVPRRSLSTRVCVLPDSIFQAIHGAELVHWLARRPYWPLTAEDARDIQSFYEGNAGGDQATDRTRKLLLRLLQYPTLRRLIVP